jgi:hypothetical protein
MPAASIAYSETRARLLVVDGAACLVHHLLHRKVAEPDREAILVAPDRAGKPEAVIGDTEEIAAWREKPKAGQLSEFAPVAGHGEATDEGQPAIITFRAGDAEFLDGTEFEGHRKGFGGKGRAGKRQKRKRCRQQARDHPARRLSPRDDRAFSSSKRPASCSVIAPASSSASTMVTARR